MPYCKQCGARVPEDARFCPSCGTRLPSEARPAETHRVLKVAGKPKVVVRNFAAGSVEVKRGAEGEVTVDLDLRYPEDIDWNISQEGEVISVTCRATAGVWGWPSSVFGPGLRANVYVSLPEETDLNVENRAGKIAVLGVKGAVLAESSAGTISIQDCDGTVTARTRAGSVNLENVNGTVAARSSAGSITFNGALGKGESWFRTNVGSIDVKLKGQSDVTVEASTNLGNIRCIPELADARYGRSHYTGRVGAGTGKLIAETNAGSITIRS